MFHFDSFSKLNDVLSLTAKKKINKKIKKIIKINKKKDNKKETKVRQENHITRLYMILTRFNLLSNDKDSKGILYKRKKKREKKKQK